MRSKLILPIGIDPREDKDDGLVLSTGLIAAVCGAIIGFFLGCGLIGVVVEFNWKSRLIEAGYAHYHAVTGDFVLNERKKNE